MVEPSTDDGIVEVNEEVVCYQDQLSRLNQECQSYAKDTYKDIACTAYRVPDVLFPREGQTGDCLTMEEIRLGLHQQFADSKHKKVSIKKLLEDRRGTLAVEKIAQRLYNWGTFHQEGMFVICNYPYRFYLSNFHSHGIEKNGDYDIIAIGKFGFIFIQVKACTIPKKVTPTRRPSENTRNDDIGIPAEGRSWRFWSEHVKDAVTQLVKDKQVFLQTNEDLQFVKYTPLHFVVGVPEIETSRNVSLQGFIQERLREEHETGMEIRTLTKEALSSQDQFTQWFNTYILPGCEATRTLFTDDVYTIVGRYTNPNYSKTPRLSAPGEGTKRASSLISLVYFTKEQEEILNKNEKRQIIAGGYGTGKSLVLVEQAIRLVLGAMNTHKICRYNDGKEVARLDDFPEDDGSNELNMSYLHETAKPTNEAKGTSTYHNEDDICSSLSAQMIDVQDNINFGDLSSAKGGHVKTLDVKSLNDESAFRGCEQQNTVSDTNLPVHCTNSSRNMSSVGEDLAPQFVARNETEKKKFAFIISCSNVGENGFVFDDPDLLVEQLEHHLKRRLAKRSTKHKRCGKQGVTITQESSNDEQLGRNLIQILQIDKIIAKAFPDLERSHSNIACENFTVDVLLEVIRHLARSKPGYTCHILLDEFPATNLVPGFLWDKLRPLSTDYPDMRLWIALSSEGNMQTFLACEDVRHISRTLGVPEEFHLDFLEVSKRMSKSVFRLMAKTQEYQGNPERSHFRCGIEISEYTPMWIPMSSCTCSNIAKGFFACTCMTARLVACLREIWKRIARAGNHEVYILFHVVMFESLREKLVKLWTEALRCLGVNCSVKVPNLENYSYTLEREEGNVDVSPSATIIHNRYFHGCEGKVMVVFPPLGGPQFQPTKDGLCLGIPFDSVIARAVSRLFIVTPSEQGMVQYGEELCTYIDREREEETARGEQKQKELKNGMEEEDGKYEAKQAKWNRFRVIFKYRTSLPSYLCRMVKEDVLVRCPTDRFDPTESWQRSNDEDIAIAKEVVEAPITKWIWIN